MSSTTQEGAIQRILVAVDGSPASLAALRVATELAGNLKAELVGIYVEDINLLRIAALPFAREISFYSTSWRQLDRTDLELQLQARARWVQRTISQMAEAANLRWTFRVVRGGIPAELLAAATDADLVILGRTGWSRRRDLGSTARIVIVQAPRPTLILHPGIRVGLPVLVAYDGSPGAKNALVASSLVITPESLLTVLVLAEDADTARKLRLEAHEWFTGRGLAPQYRWLAEVDGSALADLARKEGCGVVVIPANSERIPSGTVVDFVNESQCGVLLVR